MNDQVTAPGFRLVKEGPRRYVLEILNLDQWVYTMSKVWIFNERMTAAGWTVGTITHPQNAEGAFSYTR